MAWRRSVHDDVEFDWANCPDVEGCAVVIGVCWRDDGVGFFRAAGFSLAGAGFGFLGTARFCFAGAGLRDAGG